jgi:hypothetical protein
MIILIKAIAVLIAIISIIKSYLDYRRKHDSWIMFLFWTFVWFGSGLVVVYPPIIDKITQVSPDQAPTVSSLIALAFIFMLYIVYRVYVKAMRIEYQQSELIRKLGLEKGLNLKKQRK